MGVGLDSPWHWLVLIVVLVALFGARRLPNAAKSLAQSVRIFRSELKGPNDSDTATPPTAAAIPPATAEPASATTPPSESA